MLQRLFVVFTIAWYLFKPSLCCLINNCPSGGKRSDVEMMEPLPLEVEAENRVQHHQTRTQHYNGRIGQSCKPKGSGTNDGMCVGPFCCDPEGHDRICRMDYETCGSSRQLLEEYALCLSPGLVCDRTTLQCCNMYNRQCFESIMCEDKGATRDYYKDKDPPLKDPFLYRDHNNIYKY